MRICGDNYDIKNENGVVILAGLLEGVYYVYQKVIVFNDIAKHGWNVEFQDVNNKGYYIVSKTWSWDST